MISSNFVYVDRDSEAEKAVSYLQNFSRLGYDTETTGINIIGGESKLLLMQLGTEEVAYIFDARRIDCQILKPILESNYILKILHNAKFDYQSTRVASGIRLNNVFDTMLAYRLLTAGKDYIVGLRDKNKRRFPYKGLQFLCNKYLGMDLKKDVRKTFADFQYDREFSESQLRYAAEDILVLHPLCDILSQQLTEENLIDTALLEFRLVRAVAEMEIAGVNINRDKWESIINIAREKANEYKKQLEKMFSDVSEQNTLFGVSTVNIDSNAQLLSGLRRLGVEIENTDKSSLSECRHPVAKLIAQYRAYSKLISTYGDDLLRKINSNTGRLHFTLHQIGADTGRFSSQDPNIQNIPQDREDQEVQISFRDCFEAEEGNVILTADYSQCIPTEEWICTQYGLRQLKNCTTGAVRVPAIDKLGTVPVEAHLPKGKKETIIIRTVDGFEVSATRDHEILTTRGWKQAKFVNGDTHLVLSRDWLELNPLLEERDVAFCEMLGYWSGDGSFSSGGVQFAKTEEKYSDVYQRLNEISHIYFEKELKNYYGTWSWDLIGKSIQKEFERWGCCREKAITKQIPSLVLQTGRAGIAAYLRGLFEADGWVTSTDKNVMVAFSTRSETLSRQIQMLLLGLGIFSKRASYEEETSINGREYSGVQHRVSICDELNLSLFEERVGFISAHKRKTLLDRRKGRVRSKADVVIMPEEEHSALRTLAEKSDYWADMRREFFANYYNSSKGKIRDYTRDKLYQLFSRYPRFRPNFEYEHKAFSRVSSVGRNEICEVADLSVPSQKAFSAGGVFVHNCELRILAEYSGDEGFLNIFRNNQDLHQITAQEVFALTDEELSIFKKVKKLEESGASDIIPEELQIYKKVGDRRQKTKTINFGIAYGISAFSLAQRFKISDIEAQAILEGYFDTYFGIKRWLDINGKECLRNRYSTTILGRKRYYRLPDKEAVAEKMFNRCKRAAIRMANNHSIQGTNGDITKEALVNLQEYYETLNGDAKLLFTVHDEIVSEVKASRAEEISARKAEIMRDAFHKFVKNVPVGANDEVSVSIKPYWSK